MPVSTLPKGLIPVMIMPLTDELAIDADGLSQLTEFYLRAGSAGLFANCLSTEMYYLTGEERLAHTRQIVGQVNGRVPVVASGTFGGPLPQQADFIREIYDTGVAAVILITNQFAEPGEPDSVLLERIHELLRLTGDIPLGFYECPVPYKRLLSPQLMQELIGTGRFFYHKDTSCREEDVAAKLAAVGGGAFGFYDAHLPNALSSLRQGASGLSAIAGNYFPEILVWLCNHFDRADQRETVEWLQSELTRTNELVHTVYPVSAKYFLQCRGLPITTRSRSCPDSLDASQRRALEDLGATFHEWCQVLGIEPTAV